MTMTNKIMGGALILVILGLAGIYWIGLRMGGIEIPVVNSFQECVDAGNPVMESYPEQCRTADGRTFVNPDQVEDTPPANTTPPSAGGNGGDEPVFCTMDAFQCPDGTWVGRTGPNCEFVCPTN